MVLQRQTPECPLDVVGMRSFGNPEHCPWIIFTGHMMFTKS
jgi:hypothetical protein